ncbi:B12-binding domain-containing radical SAM protein [Streptomyces polyrhachis]|uniref:B12-binding domain-containing radical SAM protein n=1 Tax=Streptomyces polyrhachis TaxID=1282885 RepID=A0ABW2GKB9_9ACTN
MAGNEPIFPIGVRCVQDALDRAGHITQLIDFVETPEMSSTFDWLDDEWDIIGFTIRNIDPIEIAAGTHVDDYIRFIARIREELAERGLEPLLVGGGPGFSLFGDILVAKLGLDVGVVGPGENLMLDIAKDPHPYRGRRVSLQGRRHEGFLNDVLHHPPSLMDAYTEAHGAMIGVETRRKTCYQGCVYCPYAYIAGDNAGDLKPMSILAQEIQGIYDAGFRRIFFTDGIFNSELNYAKQVVRLLHELSLPDLKWAAYFTPKPFDDEFGKILAGSGIEAVVVSPDSLDDAVMRNLGKTFDTRHVLRFLERSQKYQLPVRVNVVFGGPGETRKTISNSAKFINDNLAHNELVAHMGYRILPSTELSRQAKMDAHELLYPTYYPFDLEMFNWVIQDLDSRFITPKFMINQLAGRAAARKMVKLGVQDATHAASGRTYLALASRLEGNDCGSKK